MLLLLLVTVAVVPLTNPHYLHPALLTTDNYCEGKMEVNKVTYS